MSLGYCITYTEVNNRGISLFQGKSSSIVRSIEKARGFFLPSFPHSTSILHNSSTFFHPIYPGVNGKIWSRLNLLGPAFVIFDQMFLQLIQTTGKLFFLMRPRS